MQQLPPDVPPPDVVPPPVPPPPVESPELASPEPVSPKAEPTSPKAAQSDDNEDEALEPAELKKLFREVQKKAIEMMGNTFTDAAINKLFGRVDKSNDGDLEARLVRVAPL